MPGKTENNTWKIYNKIMNSKVIILYMNRYCSKPKLGLLYKSIGILIFLFVNKILYTWTKIYAKYLNKSSQKSLITYQYLILNKNISMIWLISIQKRYIKALYQIKYGKKYIIKIWFFKFNLTTINLINRLKIWKVWRLNIQ